MPAEGLEEFNQHIRGPIEVVAEFEGQVSGEQMREDTSDVDT